MIWKTSEGTFLLQGKIHPILLTHSDASVLLPDGQHIQKAAQYLEVNALGVVLKEYPPPFTSTLDDWLYVTDIHVLLESTLFRFFWKERVWEDGEIEATPCLTGLLPWDRAALPFDPDRVIQEYRQQKPRSH